MPGCLLVPRCLLELVGLADKPLANRPQAWCHNGQSLLLEPLVRTADRLGLDGFDPCAILLNNDAGMPLGTAGFDVRTPQEMCDSLRRVTAVMQPYIKVSARVSRPL